MEIKYQIIERDDNGKPRWDFKVGDYTYHFWSAEQLTRFIEMRKLREDELTIAMREVIKTELLTKAPEELLQEKGAKEFTVTKPAILVEKKHA